jgi:signal transduction histidine kinase
LKNEVQNNKLVILGKLAASLAHEIRNPLSAIKLNLSLLEMSVEKYDPDTKESVLSAMEAVERIQYLIESTLEFSRKNVKDTDLYSLNTIAEQSLEIITSAARRKSIQIVPELSNNLPMVNISKNKTTQVILNLLTNAIEASPRNSQIFLRTYKSGKEKIIMEVADLGCGIKDEDKVKIFTDFYTNKKNGTGLGLSVCKMLLEEQNAEIDFNSKEGEGTTFTVKFKV